MFYQYSTLPVGRVFASVHGTQRVISLWHVVTTSQRAIHLFSALSTPIEHLRSPRMSEQSALHEALPPTTAYHSSGCMRYVTNSDLFSNISSCARDRYSSFASLSHPTLTPTSSMYRFP